MKPGCLLLLGRAHAALVELSDKGGLADDCPALEATRETIELLAKEIAEVPAASAAEIAVKLRIAADNIMPDAEMSTDHRCLFAAIADCERMAGAEVPAPAEPGDAAGRPA